jgi:hypothetical protein
MSELYSTSETTDAAPAADAGGQPYEEPVRTSDLTRGEGGDYTSYDDGGTLAEEEEGLLTRQEAWERTWGDDSENYDENDLSSYYDGDASTLTAEEEGLPTRQEASEQTWGDYPEHYDADELAAGYDGDAGTLADEEEGLPTRQEAWQQTWGDVSADQIADTEAVPDMSTSEHERPDEHAKPGDLASPVAIGRAGAEIEGATSERVQFHDQQGHEVSITVVRAEPEVRTVGDDSPTGTGQKPTGEELLHMEGDERSKNRLDRLFDEAFKEGDDVYDMAGHVVEPIAEDFGPRPPSGDHAPAHHAVTGAVVDNLPPAQGLAVNDVAGSITLMGVAAVVGVRHGMARIRERK